MLWQNNATCLPRGPWASQAGALGFLCPLDESSGAYAIISLFFLMADKMMTASVRWPHGYKPADSLLQTFPIVSDPGTCVLKVAPWLSSAMGKHGLCGQPHGLHYSIDLGRGGGGLVVRLRMSISSWQTFSIFIYFLFLPPHRSWLGDPAA